MVENLTINIKLSSEDFQQYGQYCVTMRKDNSPCCGFHSDEKELINKISEHLTQLEPEKEMEFEE